MDPIASEPKGRLSAIALTLTFSSLGISALLAVLVASDFIDVPWDAKVLPLSVLFGLVPYSIIGLVAACISWYRQRDMSSMISTFVGFFAIAASLATFLIIIMTAVAGHPL